MPVDLELFNDSLSYLIFLQIKKTFYLILNAVCWGKEQNFAQVTGASEQPNETNLDLCTPAVDLIIMMIITMLFYRVNTISK